jgi:hypothetical protein
MPKVDMQVGKINLDVSAPELWPFPVETKKKPAVKKVVAKKTVAKKRTVKKAK